MTHGEFKLHGLFRSHGRIWRVTDIGERTIVAIRIDQVEIESDGVRKMLSRAQAENDGWFNGPPYALAEHVFDEDDIEACTEA